MPTSVRLDPELDQLVESVAQRTGQTKSDVIRESVRSYCTQVLDGKERTLYDALAYILESAPSDPNAPRDLASNSKHYLQEGFAAEHAGDNHR